MNKNSLFSNYKKNTYLNRKRSCSESQININKNKIYTGVNISISEKEFNLKIVELINNIIFQLKKKVIPSNLKKILKIKITKFLNKLQNKPSSLKISYKEYITKEKFINKILSYLYEDLDLINDDEVRNFYFVLYSFSSDSKYNEFWNNLLNLFENHDDITRTYLELKIDLLLSCFGEKNKDITIFLLRLIYDLKLKDLIVFDITDKYLLIEDNNLKQFLKIIINTSVVEEAYFIILSNQDLNLDRKNIKANLNTIIDELDNIYFIPIINDRFLGMTLFNGNIILKDGWIKEIEYYSIGKDNIRTTLNKSAIVLTILHEITHIYRRKFINSEDCFNNTPQFSIFEDKYYDGGDGLDFLLFGSGFDRLYVDQAKFIINKDNWKKCKSLQEFADKFSKILIDVKSTFIKFKAGSGLSIGKCALSILRSG